MVMTKLTCISVYKHTDLITEQFIVTKYSIFSRLSLAFFRSQLIWICPVCKGRTYPGSAGLGLKMDTKSVVSKQKYIDYSIEKKNDHF